jgi:hypothetical protein
MIGHFHEAKVRSDAAVTDLEYWDYWRARELSKGNAALWKLSWLE